jgi:glutaredoxin
MSRKLTKEEFIEKAIAKHSDKYDYSLIEEYKGNKVKVPIICKKHGVFMQRPNDHLNGNGCPDCTRTRKLTTEEWIQMARKVHNDEYTYEHAVYKGANEKITVTCKKHGDFILKANNHLQGNGCDECRKEGIKHEKTILPKRKKSTKKLTNDEVVNRIHELYGDKYDTRYVNYTTIGKKIKLLCTQTDECGIVHGEFEITPGHLFNGEGCPKCGKNYRYTSEEFVEACRKIHGDLYDYNKVDYKRTHDDVTIICKLHGDFKQSPANHLKGQGCPTCNQSLLEKECREKLKSLNINIIEQKRFEWLGKKSLDFYLPDYNTAIECQGIQHFQPTTFSYTLTKEKAYEDILRRDKEKYEQCVNNGIKLYYYSNLGIEYPYKVYEDFDELLNEIKNGNSNKTEE